MNFQQLKDTLINVLADQLQLPADIISPQIPFRELGMSSAMGVVFIDRVGTELSLPLSSTILYDYPNLQALQACLMAMLEERTFSENTREKTHTPHDDSSPADNTAKEQIAILGADCHVPGANGLEAFWKVVREAEVSVGDIPAEHCFYQLAQQAGLNTSRPMFKAGTVGSHAQFDADFFGISAAEARAMDPQQRWLLESCWLSIQSAGMDPLQLKKSKTGVFVGASAQDFQRLLLSDNSSNDIHSGTGTSLSVIAGRIAYQFDFIGPAWAVDTACSSSLVALHQACQSLSSGECDYALVAGVNVILDPQYAQSLENGNMLSPSGRCHTFAEHADGYVRSEGYVTLFLGRPGVAYPVTPIANICATAVNQDGHSNGLTAPNGMSQRLLVTSALEKAGLDHEQIVAFECHGTGTSLGDPIEINALANVFINENNGHLPCVLGSVKACIGHLEAAAGLAGALKLAMSLHFKQWPAQPMTGAVNPLLTLEQSRLTIPLETQALSPISVNYGGVNSFGFSGTNAHAILSSVQENEEELTQPVCQWLFLSAHSEDALRLQIEQWRQVLPTLSGVYSLSLLLASALQRCASLPWRAAVFCPDIATALKTLKEVECHNTCHGEQVDSADYHIKAFLNGGNKLTVDGPLPRVWGLPQYAFTHKEYWPECIGKASVSECQEPPQYSSSERDSICERTWWDSLVVAEGQKDPSASLISLGGTSLLASRIATELQRCLGIRISVTDVLKAQTLSGLQQFVTNNTTVAEPVTAQSHSVDAELATLHTAFPLTDMQMAYWVGRGDGVAGRMPIQVFFELEAKTLDVDRLQAAWRTVMHRHLSLHSVVTTDGKQKVIASPDQPHFKHETLDKPGAECCLYIEERREMLWHSSRDLEQWPQHFVYVYQCTDQYVIHFLLDGWCIDGASYEILFRELLTVYQNPNASLPVLDLTFSHYINALSELDKSEEMSRAKLYWESQLPKLYPAPALPLVKRAEDVGKSVMKRRRSFITIEQWQQFQSQVRNHQLTPSSALMAAYALVLSRWSQHQNITLNVPRFNRQSLHPQVNDIIGEFASFTLLPCERNKQDCFVDYAQRLQQTLWEQLEHGLVSGVQLLRDLGSNVLMPYVFTTMPDHQEETLHDHLGKLGRIKEMRTQTPQVWIDCQYWVSAKGVELTWDVLEEVFPPQLIDEMFAAFTALVENLSVGKGWMALATLPLPERQELALLAINATDAELAVTSLFEMFEQQARNHPQLDALITSNEVWSYAHLLSVAEKIAALLPRGAESIAICMQKTPLCVASILAVLRQGMAYVPIDPEQPEYRRTEILTDSGAGLLLVDEESSALCWSTSIPQLVVSELMLAETALSVPEKGINQHGLAYILYTSGSTGKPKGVEITHLGICNRISDLKARFEFTERDRTMSVSAFHHDMSVFDVFITLSSGAALVMPAAEHKREPNVWIQMMNHYQVTAWNSVPAFMSMLVSTCEHANKPLPQSLRLISMGGDWIEPSLVQTLVEKLPFCRLVSVGGPTEVSLLDIIHEISVDGFKLGEAIPYGSPALNARQYIFNELLEICPEGVVGEIGHAGIGITKGYRNQPELTARRVLTDVNAELPGQESRLLRSGDLGYRRHDGEIQFVGREDFQVKVNGQRIELGEVEAQCKRLYCVNQAIALVLNAGNSPQIGVALTSNTNEHHLQLADLRRELSDRLPEYMLPRRVVVLSQLPVTPNGKVDRQAIEKRLADVKAEPSAVEGTLNKLENMIANEWKALLQIECVTPNDNFFLLGGDSLKAVALNSRLTTLTGVEKSVSHIFANPVLKQLANSYDSQAKQDSSTLSAIARGQRRRRRQNKIEQNSMSEVKIHE